MSKMELKSGILSQRSVTRSKTVSMAKTKQRLVEVEREVNQLQNEVEKLLFKLQERDGFIQVLKDELQAYVGGCMKLEAEIKELKKQLKAAQKKAKSSKPSYIKKKSSSKKADEVSEEG